MIQSISPDEVRRVTESVLSEREFQRSFSWWQLFWQGFRNFMGRISAWALQNPDLAEILTVVLSVVLILLLAHIAYTVLREFRVIRNRSATETARSRSLQALEGIAGNWTEAFRFARTALEEGNVYRALWIAHRVLLSALDRRDMLRFARWKTNSDYLSECRAEHVASQVLADVTSAYERVIYAHNDIDHEQAASLLTRVEALVQEAG